MTIGSNDDDNEGYQNNSIRYGSSWATSPENGYKTIDMSGNALAGMAPDFSEYLNHSLVNYQDTYGQPLNRPWNHDADVSGMGNSLLNSYKGAVDSYNTSSGKNMGYQVNDLSQLPYSEYAASLPAEHKGYNSFIGNAIHDPGVGMIAGFAGGTLLNGLGAAAYGPADLGEVTSANFGADAGSGSLFSGGGAGAAAGGFSPSDLGEVTSSNFGAEAGQGGLLDSGGMDFTSPSFSLDGMTADASNGANDFNNTFDNITQDYLSGSPGINTPAVTQETLAQGDFPGLSSSNPFQESPFVNSPQSGLDSFLDGYNPGTDAKNYLDNLFHPNLQGPTMPGVGQSTPDIWDMLKNRFMQNPVGNGIRAGSSIYDMFNKNSQANQVQNTAQQAANRADPFAAQRPQYQQELSQSYANPQALLNGPEYGPIGQQFAQQLARQDAAKGRRSQDYTRTLAAQAQFMQWLNQYRQGLQVPSGANIGPGYAGNYLQQGQTSANALRDQGAGSIPFALNSIFGNNSGTSTSSSLADMLNSLFK